MGLLDSLLQEIRRKAPRWSTPQDTVVAPETCSPGATRRRVWSIYPRISKPTRSEISLTSRDAALSRRECHSRLSTGRLAVCSTCPRELSVLSSTRESVARSCPRGSTSGLSTPSTASAGKTSWTEFTPTRSGRRRPRHLGRRELHARGSQLSPRALILCPLKITNHNSWLLFLSSSWLEQHLV